VVILKFTYWKQKRNEMFEINITRKLSIPFLKSLEINKLGKLTTQLENENLKN
jgi:hypothetical protein